MRSLPERWISVLVTSSGTIMLLARDARAFEQRRRNVLRRRGRRRRRRRRRRRAHHAVEVATDDAAVDAALFATFDAVRVAGVLDLLRLPASRS